MTALSPSRARESDCRVARWHELARVAVLLAGGLYLLSPFFTGRLLGAGDAVWYVNMLADFVSQVRVGVFPIFVGQTDYAFNGSVYPLRVAPYYQHFAAIIDVLTGQRLDFIVLQHVTVILSGFAGLFAAYITGVWLAPTHRWIACSAALLYLGCPGVLGTIYTQDLYMTWMAVPYLPLATYGIVRTFRHDDLRSQIWLAAPLAALWFTHSPIALWMTMIAAASQVFRLLVPHRSKASILRAAVGAALFGLLGHYPFVSVATLAIPGTASAVTSGLAEQDRITSVIHEVFPRILLPVSDHARALSDLQLGYGLWLAWALACVLACRREAARELRVLVIACAGLLLLLLPVPGVTSWLWDHLPEQIKRITFYWPMHRFYLLLAALIAAATPIACEFQRKGRSSPAPWIGIALGLAVTWSLWETRQFIRAGVERTASADVTARTFRPENRLLMNHAYGLFPALPAYFSNGVVDPRAESRLLDRTTLEAAGAQTFTRDGSLRGSVDTNPGILRLEPTLTIQPGRRYELRFRFGPHELTGILQISGTTFFREYVLPKSGERRAFGTGPDNSSVLHLWTTADAAETLTLRFIPTALGAKPADFAAFGEYSLRELLPDNAPVTTKSLLPYRAQVRADETGWLETPRMYLPGYTARVDGNEVNVLSSPQGLAMVPVAAGTSQVEVYYIPPRILQLSYWITLVAWTVFAVVVGACAVNRRLRTS